MTLDQLKYFVHAARFEHVGKAAQTLNISAGSVSTAILLLEEELQCQLFLREGRRIFLTQQGLALQQEAEKLLGQAQSLQMMFTQASTTVSGHYRLAASHYLAAQLLSPAWTQFQKTFPKLTADISSLPTVLVLNEILRGSLDLGICFSPLVHPDLNQIEIHKGQLKIALRRRHPLLMQKKKKWDLSMLSKFPATIHKSAPGIDVCENHPNFQKYGIQPEIRIQFDNDHIALQNLRQSDSWSLLPDLVIQNCPDLVSIPHPHDWRAPYSIALVHGRKASNHTLVQQFHRILIETLQAGLAGPAN